MIELTLTQYILISFGAFLLGYILRVAKEEYNK